MIADCMIPAGGHIVLGPDVGRTEKLCSHLHRCTFLKEQLSGLRLGVPRHVVLQHFLTNSCNILSDSSTPMNEDSFRRVQSVYPWTFRREFVRKEKVQQLAQKRSMPV